MTAGGVLDFTSSLFLGFRHASASLPAWSALITGVPAVLREAAGAGQVGAAVAASQGAQSGIVARSTLHALTDVLGTLPRRGDVVAVDTASYPITQTAVLTAAAKGAIVWRYPHHRPGPLTAPPGRRLLVVTDGWCPGCNRPAPLPELRRLARACGGAVVVDDSLAFGVLGGRDRGRWAQGKWAQGGSFGDGTGTPRWAGVDHSGIIWVASMAKAYGAPIAVTTGDQDTIELLAREGGNRIHSSPPSAADLAAASVALSDLRAGRVRRARLEASVRHLRAALRDAGLPVNGMPFPLVSIPLPSTSEGRRWWYWLRERGLRTVVQDRRCRAGALLSLLVRADHSDHDIDRLVVELRALARMRVAA